MRINSKKILSGAISAMLLFSTLPQAALADSAFSDTDSSIFKADIDQAAQLGIVHGYGDGTFKPDSTVTESEFAAMLSAFLTNFPDVTSKQTDAHWADGIYRNFAQYDMPFDGYGNDEIKNTSLTRKKMAQLLAAKDGFNLTERQAVYYMYENGLSAGKDSEKKNYETYGADDSLTRGEAAAFFVRIKENKDGTVFLGKSSQKGKCDSRTLEGIVNVPLVPSKAVDFDNIGGEQDSGELPVNKNVTYVTDYTDWKVQPGRTISQIPSSGWTDVTLPYTEFLQASNNLWFFRKIDIPDEQDRDFVLSMEGIQADGVLFVNNEKVKEVKGPNVKVDITEFVKPGEKVDIKIWTTKWWEGVENSREKDFFRDVSLTNMLTYFSSEQNLQACVPVGISEKVSLISQPKKAAINDVFVQTSYREKKMTVRVETRTDAALSGAKLKVQVSEIDGATEGLPSQEFDLTGGTQSVVLPWENPKLWDLGEGNLYYLLVSVVDENGNVIDSYKKVRFGFREVWTEGTSIILNGHSVELNPIMFPSCVAAVAFAEGYGVNTLLVQPNATYWFSAKNNGMFPNDKDAGMQYFTPEMLDYADEHGMMVYMSAPAVPNGDKKLAENKEIQEQYAYYFDMWHKVNDMQNRPAVISWTNTMNTGNLYDSDKLGRIDKEAIKTIDTNTSKIVSEKIIKSIDPTRLVYHHSGGLTDVGGLAGDMETLNMYPNHMNHQELEEYLIDWYNNGDKPWGSCEFGIGFPIDFMNHGRIIPQFTEYGARYYGDEAYATEKTDYIDESLDYLNRIPFDVTNCGVWDGLNKYGEFGYIHKAVDNTIYGKYMQDSISKTYESWKAMGLSYGGVPFLNTVGLGEPPQWQNDRESEMAFAYKELQNIENIDTLREKQSWNNSLYDGFKDGLSSFICFIGGPSSKDETDFTHKDHNYVSGETVEKTVVSVPNNAKNPEINISWKVRVGNDAVASGAVNRTLTRGKGDFASISFTAPQVDTKTKGYFEVVVSNAKTEKVLHEESFELTFFPCFDKVDSVASNWAIYDPLGKSAPELAKIGLNPKKIEIGDSLDGIDCLVIGTSSAIKLKDKPYKDEDVKNGLKVIYMEQPMEVLEGLGFRVQDSVPRYAFVRGKTNPIMNGIDDSDLSNWRGAGNLVGVTSAQMREWPTSRAPHIGNNNSVASVVIEAPQQGAFTPLADCEFDLAYTPIITLKDGKGEIIYSQFDLNGRLDIEPVAAKLAVNIVKYADTLSDNTAKKIVYYGGDTEDINFLNGLKLSFESISNLDSITNNDVLVIGSGMIDKNVFKKAQNFVEQGGSAVFLPQSKRSIEESGIPVKFDMTNESITMISPDKINKNESILTGIGPSLVHFRDYINVDRFKNVYKGSSLVGGLLWKLKGENDGQMLFSQLNWREIQKNSTTVNLKDNSQRVMWNVTRYYKQLFTNLGAQTTDEGIKELSTTKMIANEIPIKKWMIAETQYQVPTTTGDAGAFPGVGYPTEMDDWITKVNSNSALAAPSAWKNVDTPEDGYLNVGNIMPQSSLGTVTYAMAYLYSSVDREASFTGFIDYWAKITLNDEVIMDHSKVGRGGPPTTTALTTKGHLKKGWNRIVVKVASGSGGCCFGLKVSDSGDMNVALGEDITKLAVPENIPPVDELILDGISSLSDFYYGGSFYAEKMEENNDPYEFYPW